MGQTTKFVYEPTKENLIDSTIKIGIAETFKSRNMTLQIVSVGMFVVFIFVVFANKILSGFSKDKSNEKDNNDSNL